MGLVKRSVATTELLLILPAALFMTALFVRTLQPLQYEPARTAQQVVMWYAGRTWTLWVLLIAMPISVLAIGCATLSRGWKRAQPATLLVATATVTAGGILAIVILHMLAN